MTTEALLTIVGLGGTALGFVVRGVAYGGKKLIVDRIDALSVKLDELADTVNDMAKQNARDHGAVSERIARVEEKLNAMQSPWRRGDQSVH